MNWLVLVGLLFAAHSIFTWYHAAKRGWLARNYVSVDFPALNQWPFVSILIPAWRETETIYRCVSSLREIDYPNWEAIIIAGGSDGTYEKAREFCREDPRFTVLEQLPRGKNAALNQGLKESNGDVLVLLDADSVVQPGWLQSLVLPIIHGIPAAVGNYHPIRKTSISQHFKMEKISSYEINHSSTLQGSGSIGISKGVLLEMGGFPEYVLVGVDWDLNARLALRGIQRAYCRDAVVFTERPATIKEFWTNELRWRRAHLRSLFHLSEYFLRDLKTGFTNLYIYGLAWFTGLFTLGLIVILIFGTPEARVIAACLWSLYALWLLLRRAALVIEVTSYTQDLEWLRFIWVPPLLLCLTFGANILATLTLNRISAQFKGPRTNTSLDFRTS